jgi:hypothetical protein
MNAYEVTPPRKDCELHEVEPAVVCEHHILVLRPTIHCAYLCAAELLKIAGRCIITPFNHNPAGICRMELYRANHLGLIKLNRYCLREHTSRHPELTRVVVQHVVRVETSIT